MGLALRSSFLLPRALWVQSQTISSLISVCPGITLTSRARISRSPSPPALCSSASLFLNAVGGGTGADWEAWRSHAPLPGPRSHEAGILDKALVATSEELCFPHAALLCPLIALICKATRPGMAGSVLQGGLEGQACGTLQSCRVRVVGAPSPCSC